MMQLNLETISPLERRFNISVSQETVKIEVENRLKKFARTAKAKGFRSGKVPLNFITKQHGLQVHQEVMNDVLRKSFGEAILELKLRVVGHPYFEAKESTGDASQFEFSVTFETYPDVILGDLSAVSIEQPVMQISPIDVERTINILRKQRAKYETAEKSAAEGDEVSINYHGTINGEEFDGCKADNSLIILGDGRFLVDFEKSVIGMNIGEDKIFETTFPADYPSQTIAGRVVTFKVKLNEVRVPKFPALDSEFAKLLGVIDGDLEKMRDAVKVNLEREVSRRVKSKIKEQVMQVLLNSSTVDTPKALLTLEIERLTQIAHSDLKKRGTKVKDISLPKDLFQERAQHRVNLGLILSELVKTYNLNATSEQVREIVKDFAQNYEKPDEVVKLYYSSQDRLNEAESTALENNVVAWVLTKVAVVNKVVTYEELMGIY